MGPGLLQMYISGRASENETAAQVQALTRMTTLQALTINV
jgi:hypothetical protein